MSQAIPPASAKLRALLPWVWLPSFAIFAPLFLLALTCAILVGTLLRDLFDPAQPWAAVGLAVAILAGAMTFQIALWILMPLHVRILRLRNIEGNTSLASPKLWVWYHLTFTVYLTKILCGPLLYATGSGRWVFRMFGANIAHGAFVNTVHILDPDLIEIGPGALIGGEAWLVPHVAEQGMLVREKIVIGPGASVGLKSVVLPGARLGANCHVGAMSLVPKGAVLAANAVYGGVPVRKLRDLDNPGE